MAGLLIFGTTLFVSGDEIEIVAKPVSSSPAPELNISSVIFLQKILTHRNSAASVVTNG